MKCGPQNHANWCTDSVPCIVQGISTLWLNLNGMRILDLNSFCSRISIGEETQSIGKMDEFDTGCCYFEVGWMQKFCCISWTLQQQWICSVIQHWAKEWSKPLCKWWFILRLSSPTDPISRTSYSYAMDRKMPNDSIYSGIEFRLYSRNCCLWVFFSFRNNEHSTELFNRELAFLQHFGKHSLKNKMVIWIQLFDGHLSVFHDVR